tara:strand:- start:371 stop:748 length:378 start_codon:yes stop_codon:yes gene_type:complete
MKINVPIRKVETVQTDDGRKIEIYRKIGEVETEFKDDENTEEQMNFPEDEVIYMGVLQIQFINGNREISFPIEDVHTVEEACVQFNNLAPDFIKNLYAKMEAEAEAEQTKVVPASEETGGIILPG